jgi:hypothetical protein
VRRERAVPCEDDVDGGLEREGEGAWDLVWEVTGDGANLFREEWRLYIGGRGSTVRGDLRRERGRCRLTEERGGRGFRRGAVDGCRNLLARLQAAGWSGAEGASEGSGRWFFSDLPCLTAVVGAGEAGARPRDVP